MYSSDNRFTLFSEWKRAMLSQRQLQHPDNRPLYQYRLTETEFITLENLLCEWLAKLLPQYGLARIASLSSFSALFVLYGAEWWRQRYDGTGFSWEPILHDLGANPDDWTPTQRSECVRVGLRDWGLKPREHGALRFLGTVAVQGGLPLRLLAEARGRIGHLLKRVLQLASNSGITQSDLQSWIESLESTLPVCYRRPEIFTLLADVAWTVLNLKKEAELTSGIEAITRLDQRIPDWRERFPLPIEDDYARGLIEQLVREAASIRIQTQGLCLPLERYIEADLQGNWVLRSSLTLPDTISITQLCNLFGISEHEFPRVAELTITANAEHHSTTLRRLAGHNNCRIDRKPWGFTSEIATYEHILQLSAQDGRIWSVAAKRGEALDEDLPWTFAADDSSRNAYVCQGSGNVTSIEAFVAITETWTISNLTDATCEEVGCLDTQQRRLFRIRGDVQVTDNTGLVCRIRTGRAGSTRESYEWSGNRYWFSFLMPTVAYKGVPELYRVDEDGVKHKVTDKPGLNLVGSDTRLQQPIGPVILRYPAQGEVKLRTKMVLLPLSAKISFNCVSPESGEIHLENWGASHVRIIDAAVKQTCRSNENCLVLTLRVNPGQQAPDYVEIEVLWKHTTATSRLSVPFPAKGVRVFDGAGLELRSGALLATQQLFGTRIFILRGAEKSQISLDISANHGRTIRSHKINVHSEAVSIELRLQDYFSDIQHLLSINDSADAHVQVLLNIDGREYYRLNMARYALDIEKDGARVYLNMTKGRTYDIDALTNVTVHAIRLEHTGDEPITLAPANSEGVATGSWLFSPESREPGAWLIYPGKESSIPFRPTLWPIPGSKNTDPYAEIISISDHDEREIALEKLIDGMSRDFQHAVWLDVEQVAGLIGHLPLATLDVWRCFVRSPQWMAALALRFSSMSKDFIERFSQELPFAWETVPISAWRDAVRNLQKQCYALYGNESGDNIFISHLGSRINDISASHGALAYLLGIVLADFSKEAKKHVQALRVSSNDAINRLFEDHEGEYMRLLRNHAEDQWPDEFYYRSISESGQADLGQLIHMKNDNFLKHQEGIIKMPLLLALQAVDGKVDDWFIEPGNINALRTYRAFDPDWFDEAYNQVIAVCLAKGIMDQYQ